MNALKHGMRANLPVLPGEDPDAFHARVERWTADLQPNYDVERFLVHRAVQLSWQLERADRAIAAGLIEARAAEADRFDELAEEVAILGRRLFWDSRGPTCQYPHFVASIGPRPRVSWSGEIDDPDDPMRLLGRLEATPLGCAWLLDRWGELRDLLEAGDPWQPPDRFKAIRLLGRQPLDIWEDARVMSIYLSCGAIEDSYPHIFRDVMTELDGVEQNRFVERLNARRMTERGPVGAEAGQAELLAMIAAEEARLEAALAVHLEHDEARGVLEFDDSDVGERLRRYQASCDRTLLRVLETLRRRRREAEKSASPGRKPARPSPEKEAAAPNPLGRLAGLLEVIQAARAANATNEANGPAREAPVATNEANRDEAPVATNEANAPAEAGAVVTNEANGPADHPTHVTNEANEPADDTGRSVPGWLAVTLSLVLMVLSAALTAAVGASRGGIGPGTSARTPITTGLRSPVPDGSLPDGHREDRGIDARHGSRER